MVPSSPFICRTLTPVDSFLYSSCSVCCLKFSRRTVPAPGSSCEHPQLALLCGPSSCQEEEFDFVTCYTMCVSSRGQEQLLIYPSISVSLHQRARRSALLEIHDTTHVHKTDTHTHTHTHTHTSISQHTRAHDVSRPTTRLTLPGTVVIHCTRVWR